MPVDGDGPAGAESSESAPVDCSAITPVPASYELLEGFASSEDFVFDELGNYVGIDDDNNLVRISRDRKRTLWLPDIGSLAGMGILPDGSVVFCEVEEGALKRVYPNGAVSVVLGGLLYPNGLDIGPDGFVYVAENNGGRVRRIDPDTGEFTIVAMGLFDPNGVAFSDDPTRLYVGSFSGSGVYEVELSNPGELGRARVFARPPGARLRRPLLACPQQVEGMDCVTPYYSRAQCQAIANVVDCLPVDPCPELEEGDFCDYPETGICREQRCDPLPSCRELGEGAACDTPAGPGVCQFSDGYPFCGPPNPCAGLAPGAACEDSFFGPGTCEALDDLVYCVPLDPCEGREAGDACDDPFFGRGVCRAFDETFIFCDSLNPCEGLEDGARCEYFGFGEGVCTNAQCLLPNVCAGLPAGTPCDDPNGSSGVCQPSGDENYCLPPSSCGSLQLGDPCENLGTFGVCQSADGYLFCGEVNACDGLRAGDACDHPQTGPGVCFDDQGTLVCAPHNVCLELAPGEACEDPLWGSGVCEQGVCGGLLAPARG